MYRLTGAVLSTALTVALSGCATNNSNPQLAALEENYRSAADSHSMAAAPKAFEQAKRAVFSARDSWNRDEDSALVEHEIYVASKRIEIARARADKNIAMNTVDDAGNARLQTQLDAREQDVVEAEQRFDAVAQAATQAAAQREQAQQESSVARQTAISASQRAQSAQEQALTSQSEAIDAQQSALQTQSALNALVSEVVQSKGVEARQTDEQMVFTLEDVMFEFDKANLKPGGKRALEKIAEALALVPDANIVIEGHTDALGDDSYNLRLSEQRANAVRDELLKLGVSGQAIKAEGLGEQFPVASNDTDEGRQHNRRVEIVVADESLAVVQ